MTSDEMVAVMRGEMHRIAPDPHQDRTDAMVDAFEFGLMMGAMETPWADAYVDTMTQEEADHLLLEAEALVRAIPLR